MLGGGGKKLKSYSTTKKLGGNAFYAPYALRFSVTHVDSTLSVAGLLHLSTCTGKRLGGRRAGNICPHKTGRRTDGLQHRFLHSFIKRYAAASKYATLPLEMHFRFISRNSNLSFSNVIPTAPDLHSIVT